MQFLEDDTGISRFLEQADGGYAGGAGRDAGVGVVGSDGADGKNGKGHGAAEIPQTLDALWGAEFFF